MKAASAKSAAATRAVWIAFDTDRSTVLGEGKTAEEALKNAKKKHAESMYLTRTSPEFNEIPNESLLAAIREADEYVQSDERTAYKTVDEVMAALR